MLLFVEGRRDGTSVGVVCLPNKTRLSRQNRAAITTPFVLLSYFSLCYFNGSESGRKGCNGICGRNLRKESKVSRSEKWVGHFYQTAVSAVSGL